MARPVKATRRTRGVLGGRSDEVVARVLDAALAELAESGYAGFRMDAVAARAEVNKTTVYRRWPTRRALIGVLAERMQHTLAQSALPDTGSIETDLVAAFERRSAIGRRIEGRAWARLVAERSHPEVESIIGAAVDGRRGEWIAMVTRAIERRELPASTDPQLMLDVARAIADFRGAARKGAAWRSLAVETALAGARAGTLSRDRRRRPDR